MVPIGITAVSVTTHTPLESFTVRVRSIAIDWPPASSDPLYVAVPGTSAAVGFGALGVTSIFFANTTLFGSTVSTAIRWVMAGVIPSCALRNQYRRSL